MSRDNRKPTQAREISIETNVNLHAEGSVLVKFGNTHVICTASIDNNVPRWMKGSDKGWVTAEYGMLPENIAELVKKDFGVKSIKLRVSKPGALRGAKDVGLIIHR